jgi:hypothetical protein
MSPADQLECTMGNELKNYIGGPSEEVENAVAWWRVSEK